jgi:hypothetical protein
MSLVSNSHLETQADDRAPGDLVLTVPKRMWWGWVNEGCLPEDPEADGAREYDFTIGRKPPENLIEGTRVYIVSNGHLRGYAPLVRVRRWDETRWSFVRAGGAVACTIRDDDGLPEKIDGFRGWRWRWWPRETETPFEDWISRGVLD